GISLCYIVNIQGEQQLWHYTFFFHFNGNRTVGEYPLTSVFRTGLCGKIYPNYYREDYISGTAIGIPYKGNIRFPSNKIFKEKIVVPYKIRIIGRVETGFVIFGSIYSRKWCTPGDSQLGSSIGCIDTRLRSLYR